MLAFSAALRGRSGVDNFAGTGCARRTGLVGTGEAPSSRNPCGDDGALVGDLGGV
jgi:hypothetical protein